MSNAAIRFDLAPSDKIRFAAAVLPVLGAFGGVLRANGGSDEAALMVTVPLLFVAFFGWRFALALRQMRLATEGAEKEFWQVRDARATLRFRELAEAQQEELQELRSRQLAEQERLLREQAPNVQLAQMMERHRGEYEAILTRRTA